MYNPFKPHKVLFSNGKYGVRRWNLGWQYLDFRNVGFWWGKEKSYFQDCMVDTVENLDNCFFLITEKVLKEN